ncbi:MAG: ubiquinol-cytochrome c reductase iron-sulfur subunit [Rhodospirillaceae bacterium]|jgi:ubiquinol-cytochrome c reductase iron-sulfur subunit|nr:ubiquinol-cytochrome c reductase iron-sulfur subunit [Rhodospirillaceae bacterium]|tara:strand:+ start:480 stop:1055 length:576 start_codon:yes stop_codon:yes gene_type:complete
MEKVGVTDSESQENDSSPHEETRRDFLMISTVSVGAIGAGLAAWPFIDLMNPSKDVLALASTEIDLSGIEEGQSITAMWRGKPIFIRRRTDREINEAQTVKLSDLKDPETDDQRVKKGKSQWLVMVGICTHLGCIPMGNKSGQTRGEYNGWFCPCHGSHYDTSGRIRKGPAPKNFPIPPYKFLSDNTILIG